MKKNQNNAARASALLITFSVVLIFAFAIFLAIGAPTNTKKSARQKPSGLQGERMLAAATLGNYPDTSIPLSTDTTVTPDAPPTNTASINVSTSTDFNGTLEGNPTSGVVRVTNAHP